MVEHRHIIAILRGITPSEVVEACEVLCAAGITMIEIPLNSPDALASVKLAAEAMKGRAEIGAGTVLTVDETEAVRAVGGTFIVSPNSDPNVISHTKSLGMQSYPGVFSPTEAFAAIQSGADGLKMFPAEVLGPGGIKALKAVLPPDVPVYAVGGAVPDNFDQYFTAGCVGFGLGSYIYKPGMAVTEMAERGEKAVAAYDKGANQ